MATTADAGELEDGLAALLAEDRAVTGDARLAAALAVAAYRMVLVASVRRILAGETAPQIVDHHVARLHTAFDALDTATRRQPSRRHGARAVSFTDVTSKAPLHGFRSPPGMNAREGLC